MSPIQAYVAELAGRLRLRPAAADRLLAEVTDHLHQAADAEVAAGSARPDAEAAAIGRFGSVQEIAFAANGGTLGAATRMVGALARIGAVGSAAVLVGTLLARLAAHLTSTTAVFGLPADASPSRASVAHWLAVQPGATDWRSAAALENADDSLLLRGGVALVLLMGCAVVGWALSRRYPPLRSSATSLVPALAFTAAAAWLIAGSFLGSTAGDWGRGQALCDAGVAAVAGAAYWVAYARAHRGSAAD